MLTECPSCLTVFRVTGAILKMGHGQVRCGKCRTQFDALDTLLDDDSGDVLPDAQRTQAKSSDSEPAQDNPIEAHQPDSAEEITLEGSRIEISGTYRVAADDSSDRDNNGDQFVREHVVIDRDEPRFGEVGNDADDEERAANYLHEVPDEQVIEVNADDGESVAQAANHLMQDTTGTREPLPLSQRLWKRARGSIGNSDSQDIVDELAALTQPPQPKTPRGGVWTAVSVVLCVTLIAQAIHHYRDPLVRNPKWGGTVAGIYRTLGLNLTPNWDLRAYELQQWGVISDARDALRVRASVTNTAAFAQPYPLVKLALEDRWGAPVGMREFTPEEYLQSSATANRMMAPRQRANAEIVIVDPGADAVGFQIHACLPQDQQVICSDDLPVVNAQ